MSVAMSNLSVAPVRAPFDGDVRDRVVRVGLVGFGRAGREVAAALLKDPGTRLEWVARRSRLDDDRCAKDLLGLPGTDPGLMLSTRETAAHDLLDAHPVDAVIDFSGDDGLDYYGDAAARAGVVIVSAVSHYPEDQQRALVRLSRSTEVLWAPNITLGVNFLFMAAQALRRIAPHADVQIVEEHFAQKAGVSGTALRLAEDLGVEDDCVHAVRAGGIVGVHEVIFGFPTQSVRIRHESISREAFGEGAAFAARLLAGRGPGMYRMEDLLLPYFADAPAFTPAPVRVRRGLLERLRELAGRRPR